MKQITQTVIDKHRGNCYAACIASIFELELALLPAVPDDETVLAKFPIHDSNHFGIKDSIASWWNDMWATWFRDNNLVNIHLESNKISSYERSRFPCLHLLSGPSPRDPDQNAYGWRGMTHSVVGKNGLIYWDPHPSRQGLLAIDGLELVIPVDPSKPILESYKAIAAQTTKNS